MSIKIQAEFHGKKKECDMYINYFPNGEIDRRIVEFFQELEKDGMEVYNRNMSDYWEIQEEKKEREEYLRLKSKYDLTTNPPRE